MATSEERGSFGLVPYVCGVVLFALLRQSRPNSAMAVPTLSLPFPCSCSFQSLPLSLWLTYYVPLPEHNPARPGHQRATLRQRSEATFNSSAHMHATRSQGRLCAVMALHAKRRQWTSPGLDSLSDASSFSPPVTCLQQDRNHSATIPVADHATLRPHRVLPVPRPLDPCARRFG